MSLGSSVDTPPDGGTPPEGVYGWDWSATTHTPKGTPHTAYEVAYDLLDSLAPAVVLPGNGIHGWTRSLVAFDAEGYKTGTVFFGGRDDVHVQSTSVAAHAARPLVASRYGAKTSRVDTRVDTLLPFDALREVCESLGGRGTQVVYMEGKRLAGGDASPEETGRTLYVGAPSSMARIRVYEKWLESPGQYQDGTNRVEVQLRPPSRGKERVSGWSPAETFCATRLTQRLAAELGTELASPGSLQKSKGTPDLERSLEAMSDQYGGVVARWLSASGGDVGTVLDYLIRTAAARPAG